MICFFDTPALKTFSIFSIGCMVGAVYVVWGGVRVVCVARTILLGASKWENQNSIGRFWNDHVYGKEGVLDGPSLGNKAFAMVQTMLSCTTPPTQKPRNFHEEVYIVKTQLHEIWLADQPAEEENDEPISKRQRTGTAGRSSGTRAGSST